MPGSRLDRMQTSELPGALRLARARGPWQRGLGLMGARELPHDAGLHIPRCSSIHTFWMRFPLDLIWLDGEERPVRVDHSVPRRRVKACKGAKSVVEVNAGMGDAFAAALRGSG